MGSRPNLLLSVGIRKWLYNLSGYNQYGLRKDDLINEEIHKELQEAVRRLPPEVRDERNFRVVRAMQLSCMHRVLPEEQWTKYEEDVPYLQPIIDEVMKEEEEKRKWEES